MGNANAGGAAVVSVVMPDAGNLDVDAFKGGVILVSHDQYFVGRVAKEVWLVAKQSVKQVESFDKYREYQLKKLAPMAVELS